MNPRKVEEWCPVEGWPYEVSDHGRVRRARGGSNSTYVGRLLKLNTDRYGYQCVRLSSNGVVRDFKVHRLVCTAFNGPHPITGSGVRHLNGRPADNRAQNLAWGSPKDNARDRDAHGTTSRGEKHCRALLTQAQADELRAKHAAAQRGRQRVPRGLLAKLAVEYGLTRHGVPTIVAGGGYAT